MQHHDKPAKISVETFDEFLDGLNLLNICEEEAIKEIVADQMRDDAD